jgi:hypothetical protein
VKRHQSPPAGGTAARSTRDARIAMTISVQAGWYPRSLRTRSTRSLSVGARLSTTVPALIAGSTTSRRRPYVRSRGDVLSRSQRVKVEKATRASRHTSTIVRPETLAARRNSAAVRNALMRQPGRSRGRPKDRGAIRGEECRSLLRFEARVRREGGATGIWPAA